jgi:hypothetical protein
MYLRDIQVIGPIAVCIQQMHFVLESSVFWDLTPSSLVEAYWYLLPPPSESMNKKNFITVAVLDTVHPPLFYLTHDSFGDCILPPQWRQTLLLSIRPTWLGLPWRRRRDPASETRALNMSMLFIYLLGWIFCGDGIHFFSWMDILRWCYSFLFLDGYSTVMLLISFRGWIFWGDVIHLFSWVDILQ